VTALLAAQLDERRARRLRSMKRNAGALLVLAAAVFVAMRLWTDGTGVAGYVEAAAEAAMVGGVADWFAVTALFRHPLGIPIPHTALIPRGKDAIGEGLGEFVQRNFLDPDQIVQRIQEGDVAARLGTWLDDADHARTVAGQAAAVIAGVTDALQDEDIQQGIQDAVASRIREIEVSPIIGTVIEKAMEGGHHHTMIDAALGGFARSVAENRHVLRDRIRRESPWWVPEAVDDVLFQKVYDAAQRFVAEVTADPDHEIRRHLDARARELAGRLRDDPTLRAQAEALKHELLEHAEFQAWTDELWADIKGSLRDAADRPDSELRRRLEKAVRSAGTRLQADAELRHRVNTWIGSVSRQVAARSGNEVAAMISSTVKRWDATETSRRLELQVGRDLQFIRINGTLVGGLVGLLIHAFSSTVG
jgi:uncharacterized membrane-anchored protein YjiN (DUF445 family)